MNAKFKDQARYDERYEKAADDVQLTLEAFASNVADAMDAALTEPLDGTVVAVYELSVLRTVQVARTEYCLVYQLDNDGSVLVYGLYESGAASRLALSPLVPLDQADLDKMQRAMETATAADFDTFNKKINSQGRTIRSRTEPSDRDVQSHSRDLEFTRYYRFLH